VTITIAGRDRFWVADALIEAIRQHEDDGRTRRGRRAAAHRREIADSLRAIYDQVVP
jgi:hypothetical protein